MSADPIQESSVNPHYLNHVVATSATHEVQASEDIVARNGIKLLAKGVRIDAALRDRLLDHKLQKPLEQCLEVVDGVVPERFGPIAERLLESHGLLSALCSNFGPASPIRDSLTRLHLSKPVRSLLTVYGEHQGDRLRHSVGVAMLAMALARRLAPGEIERHRMLALAGLLHDVGELYMDPKHLARGARLGPEQWRHVVVHPVVGHRVLQSMDGAGPAVANAVLLHHERLDGFGYPRGVRGDDLAMDGQILGAAEWLMALVDSGVMPLARISVATKLIPGEFRRDIVDAVIAAAAAGGEPQAVPGTIEESMLRVVRIRSTLDRFANIRAWIDERIGEASGDLREVLISGLDRMLRIAVAFNSTGLDRADQQLLAPDEPLHLEVATIVRELEWRLRQLERESLLRGGLLDDESYRVVQELVARLKNDTAAA